MGVSIQECGGYQRSSGAPGRIRTSDLLVRSQALYPAELRAHIAMTQLSKNTRWKRCDQPIKPRQEQALVAVEAMRLVRLRQGQSGEVAGGR